MKVDTLPLLRFRIYSNGQDLFVVKPFCDGQRFVEDDVDPFLPVTKM